MTTLTFQTASKTNWMHIAELLNDNDLPLGGAEAHLDGFLLAHDGETLAGCAALERYENAALLRSVATDKRFRGTGLGQELVQRILNTAHQEGIKSVVLLTTTADQFFPRFGFTTIHREEAPEAVKVSEEFQGACPDTAIMMGLWLHHPPTLVRLARETDLPAITNIYNQGILDKATFESELRTVEERCHWLLSRQMVHPVTVAVRQGEIQGWASLNPFSVRQAYRFVADLSVYVARDKRGTGIGTTLMADLLRRASRLDYHKLVLTTFPHSTAAVRLYEHFGFRTIGDYREQGLLDGQWTDTRLMELILAPQSEGITT